MANYERVYIYSITLQGTNKCYIGSTINYRKRKGEHFWKLRNNRHDSIYLQRAWNKYGENAFKFKVIYSYLKNIEWSEEDNENFRTVIEGWWIENTNSCYCMKKSVDGNFVSSEETKNKISRAMTGRIKSKSHRKNLSKAFLGKKRSEESKNKQSLSISGKNHFRYGKCHTEKTIKKMSLANSGEKHGNSRLTTEQVIWIRKMRGKLTQQAIASKFNLTQEHISDIQNRKRWKHIN